VTVQKYARISMLCLKAVMESSYLASQQAMAAKAEVTVR
jgi:hypothetical protein